jgi:hypothetical protein
MADSVRIYVLVEDKVRIIFEEVAELCDKDGIAIHVAR